VPTLIAPAAGGVANHQSQSGIIKEGEPNPAPLLLFVDINENFAIFVRRRGLGFHLLSFTKYFYNDRYNRFREIRLQLPDLSGAAVTPDESGNYTYVSLWRHSVS